MKRALIDRTKRLQEQASKYCTSKQSNAFEKQGEARTTKLFFASVAPGDPPAKTALSSEPRYSDELFARWPPPAGFSNSFIEEVENSLRGARMGTGSPTLEQLRARKYECYEHYVILDAYLSP